MPLSIFEFPSVPAPGVTITEVYQKRDSDLLVLLHDRLSLHTLPLWLLLGRGVELCPPGPLLSLARPLAPATREIVQRLNDPQIIDPIIHFLLRFLEGRYTTVKAACLSLNIPPRIFKLAVTSGAITTVPTRNRCWSVVDLDEVHRVFSNLGDLQLFRIERSLDLTGKATGTGTRTKLGSPPPDPSKEGYLTIRDILESRRVSRPTILKYLAKRSIPGAILTTSGWLIPTKTTLPWPPRPPKPPRSKLLDSDLTSPT